MGSTKPFKIGGKTVKSGQAADIQLQVSERYTGDPINLPIRIIRSRRLGPTVFVSAAVHGDEINGTGIIHDLMFGQEIALAEERSSSSRLSIFSDLKRKTGICRIGEISTDASRVRSLGA